MEGFSFVDIYATKGIEYLIVIVFLAAAVFFQRYYAIPVEDEGKPGLLSDVVEWFRVPEGFRFHQGHSWAKVQRGDTVLVGMDDFAQKFVGKVDSLELPPVGTRLSQGAPGWILKAGGKSLPMLSPVDGEVVSVNREAIRAPGILNQDPYMKGWLIEIRAPRLSDNSRNLLSAKTARSWTEDALESLRARMSEAMGALQQDGGALGTVYQDGGSPIPGIGPALYGDAWDAVAREHFLTKGD